ncbi:type II secretion system F family protein [Vibrio sp. 10N.222.51.C8]|uniref:type II secretion system F family protein n=1 Tax=Vibrio sp. 10N.222.51.C8 TaxID=3229624 RepID=UPI0035542C10
MITYGIVALVIILSVLFIDLYFVSRKKKRMDKFFGLNKRKSNTHKMGSFLVKFGKENRKELEQRLKDAGFHTKGLAILYFPFKIFLIAVYAIYLLWLDISLMNLALYGCLGILTIVILPDMILDLRKKIVVKRISKNLPYLLDMMAVCVQTGMTIEASFSYLAKELQGFDKNLCYQVKITADSGKIKGIDRALNDLSNRLPAPEVSSFVLTIIQNIQYGSSVANILADLAEDMRKMQLLNIEEKMGKLSAKMSIPLILLIMFPIVILILAPGVSQMNFNLGAQL